ncbi:hypothetical protein OH693_08150 [Escherichia coli]|nr:hypothetical protein [Escherichia coli]
MPGVPLAGGFSGIGNKLAGSAIGQVVTKGAGALGWMGEGAGRALSRLGGPKWGHSSLPRPDGWQASYMKKQAQLAVQPVTLARRCRWQPCRTAGYGCRCHAGQCRRGVSGRFCNRPVSKWTATDKEPQEQKVNAEASLRVELGEGLRLTSSRVTEDGMGLNIYAGDNYITGW